MKTKEKLYKLLTEGKTKEVISQLKIICASIEDKDIRTGIGVQSSRFAEYEKNAMLGNVDNAEFNRIKVSLFAFIDLLGDYKDIDNIEQSLNTEDGSKLNVGQH